MMPSMAACNPESGDHPQQVSRKRATSDQCRPSLWNCCLPLVVWDDKGAVRELMLPGWEPFDFGPDARHVACEFVKHECRGVQWAIPLGHPDDGPVETRGKGELQHDHGMGFACPWHPTDEQTWILQ